MSGHTERLDRISWPSSRSTVAIVVDSVDVDSILDVDSVVVDSVIVVLEAFL